MDDPIGGLADGLAMVADAWPIDPRGFHVDVDTLGHAELVSLNNTIGALRRRVEAVHARVASEIARQSRPELGSEGLAKKNGYRSPAVLIAATTGTTIGDAARLVAVGDATAPRRTFSGADAPARHPHVAEALSDGRIGMPAASVIISMLDRVALRAGLEERDQAERMLCAQAEGLALDQVGKVVARAEAWLDPDGLEPQEHQFRGERSLLMFERGGMVHLTAKLDPESAAPVKAAIEAIVTAEFRSERAGAGGAGTDEANEDGARGAGGHGVGDHGSGTGAAPVVSSADAHMPRRTLPQRQADALVLLAAHLLGCDSADHPIEGATVIVRVALADLRDGTGSATIDGIDRPVSIATARRLAASGGVIPWVLGARGEILDWGRRRRLFTPTQRLALAERDGGCAMCGLPPGMTKAHHIRWWARDAGPTDLDNGILLCETCHHRIHDNGWEIRIEGRGVDGRVWFIPPPHVNPGRVPRLGGKARFGWAA
ncbi:HNH endonuclease [Microbacterium sp. CFH 31415]|uniref:HNH endonuclease n=1 Tax=Microbacterium sp. CFH 31415 TaxID=2921732 RepID=UPI001F12ABBB|nr:HNH endonuclease signature motif containing protein [Microbacterium sp. CFH 31415]MCH6229865.1 HNH endonuclease [Microbacterium sp. CFH 31415]